MRTTEMVIGKGQRKLILQVSTFLGEGVDFAPQAPGMLANRQVVSFHAVRVNRLADGRGFQEAVELVFQSIDQTRCHLDPPTALALFDDHRVTQCGRWTLARSRPPPARASTGWGIPLAVHVQQSVGIVRQVIPGCERDRTPSKSRHRHSPPPTFPAGSDVFPSCPRRSTTHPTGIRSDANDARSSPTRLDRGDRRGATSDRPYPCRTPSGGPSRESRPLPPSGTPPSGTLLPAFECQRMPCPPDWKTNGRTLDIANGVPHHATPPTRAARRSPTDHTTDNADSDSRTWTNT